MAENENIKELDYQMTLMMAINRVHVLSAFLKEDGKTANGDKDYAILVSVKVLENLIPDELRDRKFKNELEKNLNQKESALYNSMVRFHAIINLLYRKELLIKEKMTGD